MVSQMVFTLAIYRRCCRLETKVGRLRPAQMTLPLSLWFYTGACLYFLLLKAIQVIILKNMIKN